MSTAFAIKPLRLRWLGGMHWPEQRRPCKSSPCPARSQGCSSEWDWRGHQIQVVTLESTSDYWRIWYLVLEGAGLRVQLVNARAVKNVPGRAKTDLLTELLDVATAQGM